MFILGICLVKNEDIYIYQVLKNILDFCDEIIVLNNLSTDNTIKEVNKIKSKKIKIYNVDSPFGTNKYLKKYTNTDTWVLGVDGDELYDPVGLSEFKKELKDRKWDDYFLIKGAQINIFDLNIKDNKGTGYSNENGCRGCGKLYNFKNLTRCFSDKQERLHGYHEIKEGCKNIKLDDFDNCKLRFLHLCFINRTSKNENINFKNDDKIISFNPLINLHHNENEKKKKLSEFKDRYKKGQTVTINFIDKFFS